MRFLRRRWASATNSACASNGGSLVVAELIDAIRLHDLGFHIIAPEPVEDFVDVFLHPGRDNRKDGLDAAKEIARHPVGAAEVDLGLAAVLETKNAAVFEKSPDNAAHLDILAHIGMPALRAAHAAHHELDAHAGRGGAIEGLDHALLHQGVYLDVDSAGPPRLAHARFHCR